VPILSPTLHHRELPPQSHQRLRGRQAGRAPRRAAQAQTAHGAKRKDWCKYLGCESSVKSEALYLTTPKSQQWCYIDTFFRRHRRLKWNTIRLATNGNKRKRMDFRVRHTSGSLRYVGKVKLVCSEQRNRPDRRRKYLACNELRATARQIVMGYLLRWAVELFYFDCLTSLALA
jgi:hypothetical protein